MLPIDVLVASKVSKDFSQSQIQRCLDNPSRRQSHLEAGFPIEAFGPGSYEIN
jgi:hypothetical protein